MTRPHSTIRLARVAVALTMSLVLAACENFAAPTSTSAPGLSAPVTSAPDTASAGSPLDGTATPPAPADASTATTAPTSTSENTAARAEVRTAMTGIHERWVQCGAALPSCDVQSFEQGLTDPLLSLTQQWATQQNENGVTSTNSDTITMTVDEITINGDTALVTTCETNGGVLYNKDGSVLDGEYISAKGLWTLVLIDGQWLARGHTMTDQASGVANDICLR